MRKIFCAMILLVAMIVVGCTSENFSVTAINGDIQVEGENCNNSTGTADIELGGGGVLTGEATVKSGRIEIKIGNNTKTFDKSGAVSVDIPAGSREITFTGQDNFTGKLELKAVPKV